MRIRKSPAKQKKYHQVSRSSPNSKIFNLTRAMPINSNRFRIPIITTIVAGIVALLIKYFVFSLQPQGFINSFANHAGVFFFCYLLTAEILPEYPTLQTISGAVATLLTIIYGTGDVILIFWLLMILRLLNRSSGLTATMFDHLLIISLTYWIAKPGYWLYPAITAFIFFLESKLPYGNSRSLYSAGFAFLLIISIPAIEKPPSDIPIDWFILMVVTTLLYTSVVKQTDLTKMLDEHSNKPLNPLHLQSAQIIILIISFICAWYYGNVVMQSFLPIWAVMLSTGLYTSSKFISQKLNKQP